MKKKPIISKAAQPRQAKDGLIETFVTSRTLQASEREFCPSLKEQPQRSPSQKASSTVKRSKLNKSQLKEFAESGISGEYAALNFVNITKTNAPQLLGATTTQDELRKGTSLLGGWATSDLTIYKPKMPRQSQGKVVKYESVAKPSLLPVAHPEGTEIDESYTYYIEGSKKAVAVAQETKCRVYAFGGLSVGITLVDSLNAGKGKKRLILDNDNSIKAIRVALSLISKLTGDWEIAIFSYFKGIDDALGNGVTFSEIKFVDVANWCSHTGGYIGGNSYTFKSPQFRKPCIPSNTRVLQIEGEKGVGKSWCLRQLAGDYLKQGRNVFAVTHRINLSRKLSKEMGISYIDDESYAGGSTGLCIDSILKINISDCTGALFIIDEICQVFDHLHNSETLKYKRSLVYKKLREILHHVIETNGMICGADADFDNKSSKLLAKLSGATETEIFTIRNTFTFEKGLCQFTEGIGKLTAKGVSKRKNPSNIVAKLLNESLAGKRIFCCLSAQKVDSKFSTQVIELFLIANGVPASDILRIDSETVGDNTHPAFKAAERINELCAEFRIILASPSLNTGVDIQYKGFDYVLGIFSGTLDPNSVRQFLSRIREWNVPRIFFAPAIRQNFDDICFSQKSEFELFTSAQTEALKLIDEQWFSELNEESREKLFTASKEFYLKQSWEKERDKFDYLKRINLGLIKEGYDLDAYEDEVTVSEATNIYNQLKDIQETLKETRLELTETQEIKSEEEAQRLYEQTSLTVEEKCGLKGYEIRRKFNLPPTPEVQKALEGQTVSALENQFAAFEGAEVSKVLWEKEQYWAQERKDAKETAHDFVKRNVRVLRIKALNKVKFFDVVFNKFEKNAATELLAELRKDVLNYKLFPSLPEQDSKQSIKAVKAIAQLFNLDIKQVGGKTNKGTRFYKAVDRGLLLSDSLEDVKPKVFDFWLQERKKKADDWQAFKRDIYLVKRSEKLDGTKNLPPLSDDFKYTKLSTRARTMPIPIQPCYRMVDSENLSDFKLWLATRPELAVDIETYGEGAKGGLNHVRGSIRLIQFADWGAIWILEQRDFDLVRNEVRAMLKNPKQRKVGHNFMFDLRFLRKEFGVLAKNCADTMLGSRCLLGDMGAAQITSHSLQQACENFLGIEVDKTEQKSDWGISELTPEQLSYAAKDPWLTYVLYKRLEALTKQPSLLLLPFPEMMAWEAWEVENRFLFAAQQMENTGYQIDMELLANTKAQYEAVRDELTGKWDAPFLPTQKAKLQQFLNEKYGLSLKSLGKAIAAENSDIPEIKLMQQICACDAILHTLGSIESQLELLGRVKPIFSVLSGTGRTSSGATSIEKCLINLQSLAARVNPVLKDFKLPALKALFKTNLIIDLPASHGRISAELGDDDNALAAYMDESIDLHCSTAAAVAQAVFPDKNYTAEWIKANKKSGDAKGLRDTAKNTYYGWLNGAGVATIQRQIKSNLQINADKSACQKALEGLQNVFSGTTNYAKGKLKELEENQFIVNGIVCGWMEFAGTYLCWKLGFLGGDLKVPATKAFAGIWSRTESLLMKRACYRVAEKFDEIPEWKSRLQNFIHDEINAEIGCEDAARFAHAVVREEFGRICYRTIDGFDPFEKCYPLKNWNDK